MLKEMSIIFIVAGFFSTLKTFVYSSPIEHLNFICPLLCSFSYALPLISKWIKISL